MSSEDTPAPSSLLYWANYAGPGSAYQKCMRGIWSICPGYTASTYGIKRTVNPEPFEIKTVFQGFRIPIIKMRPSFQVISYAVDFLL